MGELGEVFLEAPKVAGGEVEEDGFALFVATRPERWIGRTGAGAGHWGWSGVEDGRVVWMWGDEMGDERNC